MHFLQLILIFFSSHFYWICFQGIQLTITQYLLILQLDTFRRQSLILTNVDFVHPCIYTSSSPNEWVKRYFDGKCLIVFTTAIAHYMHGIKQTPSHYQNHLWPSSRMSPANQKSASVCLHITSDPNQTTQSAQTEYVAWQCCRVYSRNSQKKKTQVSARFISKIDHILNM